MLSSSNFNFGIQCFHLYFKESKNVTAGIGILIWFIVGESQGRGAIAPHFGMRQFGVHVPVLQYQQALYKLLGIKLLKEIKTVLA